VKVKKRMGRGWGDKGERVGRRRKEVWKKGFSNATTRPRGGVVAIDRTHQKKQSEEKGGKEETLQKRPLGLLEERGKDMYCPKKIPKGEKGVEPARPD